MADNYSFIITVQKRNKIIHGFLLISNFPSGVEFEVLLCSLFLLFGMICSQYFVVVVSIEITTPQGEEG